MRTIGLSSLIALVAACGPAGADPSGAGSAQPAPAAAAPVEVREISGEVIQTEDVPSYTYVQVDTGDEVVWAAAPSTPVEVGDRVHLGDAAPMREFYSPTLLRTFDWIYFASSLRVEGGEAGEMRDVRSFHPAERGPAPVDTSGVEPLPGGLRVAEVLENAADLAGREVGVRGVVVKFTPGVMGRNWLHLRDGSGGPGDAGELTVTTEAAAEEGDTVVVRGTLRVDRDFGYGYRYDVLIEDASLAVE